MLNYLNDFWAFKAFIIPGKRSFPVFLLSFHYFFERWFIFVFFVRIHEDISYTNERITISKNTN
jgi:hypothetical protein